MMLSQGQCAPVASTEVTLSQRAANPFLMAFAITLLVNHLGRPFELILVGLRIPFVICNGAIAVAIFAGALKGLWSKVGWPLIALAWWMGVAALFSFDWKGSVVYIVRTNLLLVTLFLILAAAPRSLRHIRSIATAVAWSCVLHLILFRSSSTSSRLTLDGTFGNADDVALMAGFAVPFWVIFCMKIRNRVVCILMLIPGVIFLLYSVAASAARTGVMGLALVAMALFLHLSLIGRVALVTSVICISSIIAVSLPADVRERLATVGKSLDPSAVGEDTVEAEALESAAARRATAEDALEMIRTHPLVGVGAGRYTDYRFTILHHRFLASHNTYLQIASENGIPALMLYVAFLLAICKTILNAWRLNAPGSHPYWKDGRILALCLELGAVYYIPCAFFLTLDRHPEVYVLAGLAVALERVCRNLVAEAKETSGSPKGATFFPFGSAVAQPAGTQSARPAAVAWVSPRRA
jgi:O-antigen ligase